MNRFPADVKHILKPGLVRKGSTHLAPKAKRPRGTTIQTLTNCKLAIEMTWYKRRQTPFDANVTLLYRRYN